MKRHAWSLVLMTVVCVLATPPPASADFSFDLNPVTVEGLQDLLAAMDAQGLFKCCPRGLANLLELTATLASADSRQALLELEVDCCNTPTEEINPATGLPFASFPAVANPDRALFLHTALAQNVGDCLCDGLKALRDGTPARIQVQVIGNASTCSFSLL